MTNVASVLFEFSYLNDSNFLNNAPPPGGIRPVSATEKDACGWLEVFSKRIGSVDLSKKGALAINGYPISHTTTISKGLHPVNSSEVVQGIRVELDDSSVDPYNREELPILLQIKIMGKRYCFVFHAGEQSRHYETITPGRFEMSTSEVCIFDDTTAPFMPHPIFSNWHDLYHDVYFMSDKSGMVIPNSFSSPELAITVTPRGGFEIGSFLSEKRDKSSGSYMNEVHLCMGAVNKFSNDPQVLSSRNLNYSIALMYNSARINGVIPPDMNVYKNSGYSAKRKKVSTIVSTPPARVESEPTPILNPDGFPPAEPLYDMARLPFLPYGYRWLTSVYGVPLIADNKNNIYMPFEILDSHEAVDEEEAELISKLMVHVMKLGETMVTNARVFGGESN